MIGLLRGKLIDKRPNQVLLDVGGVGYQVQVSLLTYAGIGALHSEATLLIHTHVREDQLALYGFVTAREKQCFELLLSASGVGPSLALKILSGMSLEQLIPAIRKGDIARLVLIPGVGKTLAERIVVELRDKLAVVDVPEAGKPATRSQTEADVASALVNLGYDERSVEKAIVKSRGTGGGDFEKRFAPRVALKTLGAPPCTQDGARKDARNEARDGGRGGPVCVGIRGARGQGEGIRALLFRVGAVGRAVSQECRVPRNRDAPRFRKPAPLPYHRPLKAGSPFEARRRHAREV